MRIFKSIKWRLQLWYGLILVVVLAGFGFTAYQLERNRQFRQLDDELHHRASVLGAALHHPPPREGEGDQPMLEDRRGRPETDQGEPPLDGLPPEGPPEDGPQGRHFHGPTRFQLPPEAAHFFDASDRHDFYFAIRGRDGADIAHSTNQPARAIAYRATMISENFPTPHGNPPRTLVLGEDREVVNTLPSGETIWVGCSMAPELAELRMVAWTLSGVGMAILLLGLAGGWWLVSRALNPIGDISAAAAKISAGDLSQRINVAEAESELGELAAVLNSTFARLESAFAQQKQFAADAAHELRTPVSVMLTQTQTALQRERDAAGYKQTVEACQRAAQRMRKLIESLLALARFDAGQEVLKRIRFDLAQTANDCLEMVRPLAVERDVILRIEAEPLEVIGDPERLAQVITNLLTNAIQYNRPQGEVCLKLMGQGNLAVLTVTDTGQGMAAAELPRVFRRFYRADKSRTGGGNAGLGLAISKAIIEAHAGTIELMSEENTGTVFTVRLPIG
jgi:two-component system OmpR family sensor kinase